MKKTVKDNVVGLSVTIPIMVYFIIFTLVPLCMLFVYSFTDYSIIKNQFNFLWFKQYALIFSDIQYLFSLGITFFIAIFVVAIGMVVGFMLAYLLNKLMYGKGFLRTIWYIPALISMAIISTLVDIMLGPEGSLNLLFNGLGLPVQDFYGSTFWMFFFIILIVSWKGLGGTALYYIAGLNGVDKEIYEAAEIDGSHGLHKIIHITLPLMKPMLGYILITGFIGAFNIFEPVMLISKGGPDSSTKVILYRIYDQAFENGNLGFASALSVVVFFVVLALTYVNMKITDDSLFGGSSKRRVK